MDYYGVLKPPEKCKINPFPDLITNDAYCFDLMYFDMDDLKSEKGNAVLFLHYLDNYTKSNVEPAEIQIVMLTPDLKIDHSKKNPFIESGYFGNLHTMRIETDVYMGYYYTFTTILYDSSEILNTKKKFY